MAEAQLFLSSFKEQFDDQLTCGVCLDKYTDPKMLTCGHTFCLECIQQLPVQKKEDQHYINCPTCRVDHLSPQGGAIDLPNAFQINSLFDLQKKLATLRQTLHSSKSTICLKHNDPLKVYCETCCQVICRDCTISKEHNAHNFNLISECYSKHQQEIKDSLYLVNLTMADIATAVTHLATRKREVLQQGQKLKEQINTHAQQIIDLVKRSHTCLSQQVDVIVHQKTQILTAQRQQAQKLHTKLKTCQDMIEHSLKEWTQLQILAAKHTLMNEMNTATQHVDPAVFQPIENFDDMQLVKTQTSKEEIGIITSTTYKKATLKASPCLAKQPSTATLTLQSHDNLQLSLPPSLISSFLFSPSYSTKCDINQTHPGKYNIKFTPSTKHDQLMVQVGGVDVPDSPFKLTVIPTPEMRGKPVNIITGLNRPWGIAVCDNGDIVVAEFGAHCITILNRNGTKVRSFGSKARTFGTKINEGKFIFPHGVAKTDDGHILVTDSNRLQKLTTDGICVKSVGSSKEGRGPLEFNYPAGIAVHPTTGQIFVADSYNNRIQVFTTSLTFSHTITHKKIKGPYDLALDNEGNLYTTCYDNHSIIKFTQTGQYIAKVAVIGTAPTAMYLTIHNNLVYVSECSNNRVSIFDTTGQLLHSLDKKISGKEEFNEPRGIIIDTIGNLYVSDTGNGRIVAF